MNIKENAASFPDRLAERSGRTLSTRTTRCGFLSRATTIGAVIAAGPLRFLTRPSPAWAACPGCTFSGCNCNQRCCSNNNSAFCCLQFPSVGNQCPNGTQVCGYWRCGNLYYYDCCGGCGGCACSNCNNGRTCCNNNTWQNCNGCGATSCGKVVCRFTRTGRAGICSASIPDRCYSGDQLPSCAANG